MKIRLRKKKQLIIFTLVIATITFVISTYLAYQDLRATYYEQNNLPKIVIENFSNQIHIGDVFILKIAFSNLKNFDNEYQYLENDVKKIIGAYDFQDFKIIDYHNENIRSNRFVSFILQVKVRANKKTSKTILLNKQIKISPNYSLSITGELPKIAGDFEYTYDYYPKEMHEGDAFTLVVNIETTREIIKYPEIKFRATPNKGQPILLSETEGKISEGKYQIVNKYNTNNAGIFLTEQQTFTTNNGSYNLETIEVKVDKLQADYKVKITPPTYVNDEFNISVELKNIPINNPRPEFPSNTKFKKLELSTETSFVNSKIHNIIYNQKYKALLDGNYSPGTIKLNIDNKTITYKIDPINVRFDCSAPDLIRLPNGFRVINRTQRSTGNKLELTNNDSEDIYIKVINYYTHKAILSTYLWSYNSCTLSNIPKGKYFLAVAYGNHWNPKKNGFSCDKEFQLFDKDKDLFEYDSDYFGTWKLTHVKTRTDSYYNTPKDISETDFEDY